MKNIIIYGELEPYTNEYRNKNKNSDDNESENDSGHADGLKKEKQNHQNIPIVIRHPIKWMVDRCPNGVGYWIQSKLAWYYLKQPDRTIRTLTTSRKVLNITYSSANSKNTNKLPTSISMEDLFLPYRALLGLFTNIVDMLGERNDVQEQRNIDNQNTANCHINYSPEECHEQLTATDGIVTLLNNGSSNFNLPNNHCTGRQTQLSHLLNKDPFDLLFLKQEGSNFVIKHLQTNIFSNLHANCKFLQGLRKMDTNFKLAKRNGEKSAMLYPFNGVQCKYKNKNYYEHYRQLAVAAEQRSQRLPWGEQRSPKNSKF
jgi:hypothetical protein